jgi:hypothetical protein
MGMNLQSAAEGENERRTRSRLEPHREAIFTLRRKHWTYSQIAKWLNKHGVAITLSSVQRFCERAIARRPRAGNEPQPVENQTLSNPQPKTQKHRFNIPI